MWIGVLCTSAKALLPASRSVMVARSRGQRANDIIADEFASIPRDIFENVVAGFAAVAASPIDKVKQKAKERKAKELGIPISSPEQQDAGATKSNQIILSGTAYYDFNHFAEYWKRYHAIVSEWRERVPSTRSFRWSCSC